MVPILDVLLVDSLSATPHILLGAPPPSCVGCAPLIHATGSLRSLLSLLLPQAPSVAVWVGTVLSPSLATVFLHGLAAVD